MADPWLTLRSRDATSNLPRKIRLRPPGRAVRLQP